VSQSGVEMGRRAADLLLDLIEAGETGDPLPDVVLKPTLIVRDSTARPPMSER
jgi:DNA-binding LacI/PurR family transcriptional regulator